MILGAGASYPYGFPLGDELVKNIIKCIRKDNVFFPYDIKILNHKNHFSLHDYKILLKETSVQFLNLIREQIKSGKKVVESAHIITNPNDNIVGKSIYRSFYAQDLVKIKLDHIKELHQLANMLEDFDPVSIDAFLRDHPEHKIAGQTMIIYCLIKCHNSEKLKKNLPDDNAFLNKNECAYKLNNIIPQDNWYRYLLNDIKSRCSQPSDLLKNKLSIATFNYDVSLDYYLKNKLMNTSYFKDYASQYLSTLDITHIYGSICDFNNVNELYDDVSAKLQITTILPKRRDKFIAAYIICNGLNLM